MTLMAGYTGGRIKRIKIHNFMTYEDVEIFPKKGLNLIVGLNGSGKSSIMCAICLGLAGKPQFTGRASALSEFIKHGEHNAEVEIELESFRGNNNVIISRKIKEGERCEWHLNHRSSNQNEVISTVRKFNIDTSNLCQFLPQEKVVEFSRMDKKQRLENMLQAIGEPHLFELFNELKDLRKQSVEIETSIRKYQQNKNTAEEKNERISDEVQKQESRVRLKNELDDLCNRRKLLAYKEYQSEWMSLKTEQKNLEIELATLRMKRDKAVEDESAVQSECMKHFRELKHLKSLREDKNGKVTRKSNEIIQCNEQVHNAKIEYKNRLQEKENQKKRLQDITIQIEGLEKLLEEERKKNETLEEQMQSNSQELTQLQTEIRELYKNVEDISAEWNNYSYSIKDLKNQLAKMQDEQNKKMTNLKKWDKYTCEAVCWLNDHKNTFKSNIYQPIMLEIKVHSAENCKYVENHISIRDMLAFVCEDKEDCKRLTDILKNQKRLPVNIVMAPDTSTEYASPVLNNNFRRSGLECFLIDLFTAPEPVMRYLCACYNIHNIPVSKSTVDGDQIEIILPKFKIFFSGNTKICGKRSRYGDQNWSIRKDFISEQNWLINFDDEHQKVLEKSLQEKENKFHFVQKQLESVRFKVNEKEQHQERLRQQRRELYQREKRVQGLATQLAQKKSVRQQMSVVIVKEEEKAKVTEKIQFINKERDKIFRSLNELFKDYANLQNGIIKQSVNISCLSKELKLLRASNEEIHDKVKEIGEEVEKMKKLVQEKKITAKQLLEEVKKIKIDSSTAHNLGSLEEIEEKINHVQAQLSLNEDNESLIKEYQARKERIDAIQADISKFGRILDELKITMERKKHEWLEPLQHHISNINGKFSRYFKHLSCAGEISLDIPENSEDFGSYGLQIKLKFHDDEPLTELSQTHHSGGECSVAAIVFILSLQELTEVPFRCIDEINQGMDSINERKIYQLIADSVGDDKCSQYFLLTPKLLMDLHYPDDVAVHIIYNSSFLNMKLDIRKLLQVAQSE